MEEKLWEANVKNYPKRLWKVLKVAYKEFAQDDSFTLGSSLSYYTIFSLAPVLIIVIAVAGMIFGREAVEGEIYGQIKGMLGGESALQIQNMVKKAYQPGKSTIATIIAAALLIFGATSVFGQLQQSINKIWGVKPKPKKGYIQYIKDRFLSFSLIIAIGFILLVSLVINAALGALSDYISSLLPDYSIYLFQGIDFVLSLGIITLLFAMIYRFLPDAVVRWRDVWIGAFFTALLFTLGRFAIGYYLGQADIGSTYGAAGSIVVILVWVNYSSQILFFGAEFTQAYAREIGERIIPRQYAVRIQMVEVEQKDNETTENFEEKVKKVQETCDAESSKIPDSELEKAEKNKDC